MLVDDCGSTMGWTSASVRGGWSTPGGCRNSAINFGGSVPSLHPAGSIRSLRSQHSMQVLKKQEFMILSMDFRLIESSDFCLYLYSILVFLYFLNINSFVTNFVPQLIPISLRCVDSQRLSLLFLQTTHPFREILRNYYIEKTKYDNKSIDKSRSNGIRMVH